MPTPSPLARPHLRRLAVGVVLATTVAGAPALSPAAGAQVVPLKDVNQPAYTSLAVGWNGTGTTLTPGSFYNTDLSPGTVMRRTADTPEWVTVNADNSLTFRPTAAVPAGPKRIPVNSVYTDGSSELTWAKIYVFDPAAGPTSAQMLGFAPEVRVRKSGFKMSPAYLPDLKVPNGAKVTADTGAVPAGVTVTADPATGTMLVNITPTAAAGEFEVPLLVTIPGQPDFRDVVRVQIDPDQATRNTPGYPALSVRPGVSAKLAQTGDTTMPAGTIAAVDASSVPSGWKATVDPATAELTVTAPENAARGAKADVKVVFTYPDGSTETAAAAVVVGAAEGSLAGGSIEGLGGPLLLIGALGLGAVAIGALVQMIQSMMPGLGLPPVVVPPGPSIPNGRG